MNKRVLDIAINRCRIIPVEKEDRSVITHLFLTQLAQLGFKVKNPDLINDSIALNYKEILDGLKTLKGADLNYVPLFKNFPNHSDKTENLDKTEILAIFNSLHATTPKNSNSYLFGANPVTGMQSKELYENALKEISQRKLDTHSEFTMLEAATMQQTEQRVQEWAQEVLASDGAFKSSIKTDLILTLMYFKFDIDLETVRFKENLEPIFNHLWIEDRDALSRVLTNPTDILRLFATLTKSDVSLAQNITFPKLSRPDREYILDNMEDMSNLAEDMDRYRMLWLAIGNMLHPGDYKDKFPNTWNAFNLIRKDSVRSFQSYYDEYVKKGQIDKLLGMLKHRPTVFARKLNHLLRIAPSPAMIAMEFEKVAHKVPLKVLLTIESYFEGINSAGLRPIVNKYGRFKAIDNTQDKLDEQAITFIQSAIKAGIVNHATEMNVFEGKKVWMDEKINNYILPLQQRNASEGLRSISRGSSLPVEFSNSEVVRLFLYWEQSKITTDIDLSVIILDENFNQISQVSYTNLDACEGAIKHSGDIRSAPKGASEFIDINVERLTKNAPKARYFVPQVYMFSGESFENLKDIFSGWMVRSKEGSRQKPFNPKTVVDKFRLHGERGICTPCIFDISEKTMTSVDIYSGLRNQRGYNTETAGTDSISVLRGILEYKHLKPNLAQLFMHHIESSDCEQVEDKVDADLVLDADLAQQPHKILSNYI